MNNLFYRYYRQQSMLFNLILANVAVFIVVELVDVVYVLFNLPHNQFYIFWNYLSLSGTPSFFITRPWTLVTYMFMHDENNIMHILFNMLLLYWFGRIYLDFRKEKTILWLYLFGGIAGGLAFILAYQIIPVLKIHIPELGLVGASASVTAIMMATAFLVPDYGVNLFLIGKVKLKYIAMALVVIDIISLKGTNSGGHFAHLGGAIYGMLYTLNLRGRLWPLNQAAGFISGIINRLNKKNIREIPFMKVKEKSVKNTQDSLNEKQEIIDIILDKISKSGYDSLTDEEREKLFNASRK
jgi:membrane associated rhomboid family serine protease